MTSASLAEAFSLMLATQLVGMLLLQQSTFLTELATLAKAAAPQSPILAPGHWTIMRQLAYIAASSAFASSRIYHIPRNYNFRAHHQAKLAPRLKNRTFSFKCLASGNDTCLNAHVMVQSPVLQCTFVHVRCCQINKIYFVFKEKKNSCPPFDPERNAAPPPASTEVWQGFHPELTKPILTPANPAKMPPVATNHASQHTVAAIHQSHGQQTPSAPPPHNHPPIPPLRC